MLALLLLAPLVLQAGEPPSRALSRELCSAPRLAGTLGSRRAALWVAEELEAAGFEVELDERVVLLSLPRRLAIACRVGAETLFERVETFDPDAVPPGDVPRFNAWSASGSVEASVVDVGRGLPGDFARLQREGVPVAGRIAIARYGGSYRGVKAEQAQLHGCVGLVLFNDPAEDGAGRGAVWPAGPWKPGWAAQRGAISPLARSPGDPSTPGWPSPAPGEEGRRLDVARTSEFLPRIPCLPIGADDALRILGAGPEARVALDLDVPRTLRPIVNVIATLPGTGAGLVLAGNHRDAWVRGAQDAGGGTVSLLRAAQHLGARARAGWRPANGIVLGFWDAEESGLIGSTEWGEANAERLTRDGVAYVNADAAVGGTRFGASGTPGLLLLLREALARVPAPEDSDGSRPEHLWAQWSANDTRTPELGLPGSGSDYTVFLHHLGLPVLDVSFGGNSGGQYHTRFDDFELMDRFLDPTWEGHETAGLALAEILAVLAERGRAGFDHPSAARRMAAMVRRTGSESWLGAERAERLAKAFDRLERALGAARPEHTFFQAFLAPEGLPDRPWYRNLLWAPGLDTGYAAKSLPLLRLAADESEEALDARIDGLRARADAFGASLGEGSR